MIHDLNILSHEILAVLKRNGMTITATGNNDKGHTPIYKFQIESARLQFGMLVGLVNDYDKYSSQVNNQSILSSQRKLTREQVEIIKYDWQDVAMAIDNLQFNEDVIDKTLGGYLEIYDREIKLTQKGLISFNTEFYLKQSQKEKYTEQLSISTISTNKSVRRTNRFQIGTLILTGLIAIMACIFQGLSYRLQQEQKLQDQTQLEMVKSDIQSLTKSIEILQKKINLIDTLQKKDLPDTHNINR